MTADIAHNERMEESESGPRQKQLKTALKKLGDVARYHGGDLQGKQVQKLLDCARNETFEILDCIKDLESLHAKYSTALTCLANVSDALRYSGEDFDDEGVENFARIGENLASPLSKSKHYSEGAHTGFCASKSC